MDVRWQLHSDILGPKAVVFVRDPAVGLDGCVVVDNVAAGPAIGGVRVAPDVTVEEVLRLARAMTLKNAAAGLPHGGGKSGITADPRMPAADKERLLRAFGRAIADLRDYIPGPDMGLDETAMAWLHDEMGRAVGLPAVLGGIPLDTLGSTGYGVAIAAEVVADHLDMPLDGARVAVQGFGAVGRHAATFLAERGAAVVAVSDSSGAVQDPAGLDLDKLIDHKAAGASVGTFPSGHAIPRDDLVTVDCDLLVPAARPDVLTAANAGSVRARAVLEGANIPATEDAEAMLHERGVVVVPDFIANAGGVITAAVEYHGGTATQAFAAIEEKIRANTRAVLDRAARHAIRPRVAAVELAQERVEEAMRYQRH